MQGGGKIVSVASTLLTNPPMVSDESCRQLNYSIELNGLHEHMRREFGGGDSSGSHQIYDPEKDGK